MSLVCLLMMLMLSGSALSEVSTEVFPAAMTSSTEEPCDVTTCLKECADGFEIDERGCQACRCRLATVASSSSSPSSSSSNACPPIDCPPCPSDRRAVDAKGCSTCECVQRGEGGGEGGRKGEGKGGEDCPPPVCTLHCEHGRRNDDNGCQICECNDPPPESNGCPRLTDCRVQCDAGRRTDDNGCPLCRCNDPDEPTTTLATAVCTGLMTCRLHCPHGNEKDSDGCDICRCQGDPCDKFTCDSNEKCISEQTEEGNFVARCTDDDHRCPALNCHLECQDDDFDLVDDQSGCTVCRCKPRAATDGPPPYDPCHPLLECSPCPDDNAYETDENGCRTSCHCVAGGPDNGTNICPELSVACRTRCPDGLRRGEDGCPVCECVETEQRQRLRTECPQLQASCRMSCPHGQEKDGSGCDLCRCRNDTSAAVDCGRTAEASCSARCRLGFAKDVNGCEICACEEDFCENFPCSEEETCAIKIDDEGKFVAKCIPGRRWCSSRKECTTPCEQGFMHDATGCPLCSCLDRRLDGCRDIAWCSRVCEFGHQRNEHGCRICDCLPNPCQQNQSCSAGEVCEVFRFRNCRNCPATTKCIASSDVRRLYVVFTYEHSYVRNLDIEKFSAQVTESVSRLLAFNASASVYNVSVTPLTRLKTRAAFHIVDPGLDLVTVAGDLLSTLRDPQAPVTFELNRVTFAPQQDTAVVMYYSSEEVEEGLLGLADVDQSPMGDGAVVASCLVGIVFVAVCSAVMFVMLRRSRQEKPNIIYKRVILG